MNAFDEKFEDFVAAGVRTAELVAAGARAASHVADVVLGLCRGGGDDREPARGISETKPGIGSNATASISIGISLNAIIRRLFRFTIISVFFRRRLVCILSLPVPNQNLRRRGRANAGEGRKECSQRREARAPH